MFCQLLKLFIMLIIVWKFLIKNRSYQEVKTSRCIWMLRLDVFLNIANGFFRKQDKENKFANTKSISSNIKIKTNKKQ